MDITTIQIQGHAAKGVECYQIQLTHHLFVLTSAALLDLS